MALHFHAVSKPRLHLHLQNSLSSIRPGLHKQLPSPVLICCRKKQHSSMESSHGPLQKHNSSITVHAFSDLSRLSPLFFVRLLKDSYVPGNGKAIIKFQVLRQQVIIALVSAPPPGPATYVVYCLSILNLIDTHNNEALSHLLTSALTCLDKNNVSFADAAEARMLASRIFLNVIMGIVSVGERILVKLATVFGIQLRDLEKIVHMPLLDEAEKIQKVKACLELFILRLIKARLYTSAVALLKQFSLQHSSPHDFLVTMICDNQFEAAEEWAVYMGKTMICSLVQQCMEMTMFKRAYNIVKKYNLQLEFPDAYHQYRKSTLRKLVEKGCWDIAESIAIEDCKLVEYLVDLAREIGDAEKAADLCYRHEIAYIPFCSVDGGRPMIQYLQLQDFVPEENVIWVETIAGLADASCHFSNTNIVGIDCEWRPNYIKEEKTSKVSILQVATRERVYIIDLIKFYKHNRDELDNFIKSIFYSRNILKLGYALHNDLKQLLHSYGDMTCFHYCEPILDLQRFHNHSKGGLSGLAKITLGSYLSKTTHMTDWEQRPLNLSQLHYAALDAVVLISIFDFVSREALALGEGNRDLSDWMSHVTLFGSRLGHKKYPIVDDQKAQSIVSLATNEVDTKLISSRFLVAENENPVPDHASKVMGIAVSDEDTEISGSLDMARALKEDLVYASCELLGLPLPGILKSELQEHAQAAMLPLPIYNISHRLGPGNSKLFSCTLTVGNMKFFGRLCSSKKEAEIWAAIHAILCLFQC